MKMFRLALIVIAAITLMLATVSSASADVLMITPGGPGVVGLPEAAIDAITESGQGQIQFGFVPPPPGGDPGI